MQINKISTGPVAANSYVICNNGIGAVVDSGQCTDSLLELIEDSGISELKYILLTHGHFDHIDGVSELKRHFPDAEICIHREDKECLSDDLLSMARGFGLPPQEKVQADRSLEDGDVLPFGDKKIKVIHTPGHTLGGVTYLIDDCLFTGDTLFCRSVGRTDFPGGDFFTIVKSVNRLYSLLGNYKVYPGHDSETDLDSERKLNAYVKQK